MTNVPLSGCCYAFDFDGGTVLAKADAVSLNDDEFYTDEDPSVYICLSGCSVQLRIGQLVQYADSTYRVVSCDAVRNAQIRRVANSEKE